MSEGPGGAGRGTGPEVDIPVEYVNVHGHVIGVRRAGSGPVLLLLHGIAGSSTSWVPVMAQLRDRFTVVAPDLVGHGSSAKPTGDYSIGNLASWIRDLLDLLDIDRATVVGHSYGGGVALQFAYQFPERCERLVLVDAGGLGPEVSWVLRLATLPGAEAVLPVLFSPALRLVGDRAAAVLRRLGVHNASAAEIWRSVRSLTDPETRRAFLRTTRSVIGPGGQLIAAGERLYLAEDLPLLIVWGDRDRMIPLSHAFETQQALPHSRLEVLGTGHFPHAQDPVRFAHLIDDFVRDTEPRVHSSRTARELLRRGPKPPAGTETGGAAPRRRGVTGDR